MPTIEPASSETSTTLLNTWSSGHDVRSNAGLRRPSPRGDGERRLVRATPQFFADLDRQLHHERPNGDSSANDFQSLDLLQIVEEFATGFDDLPALIAGRSDYRILITTRAW